jgi:hypothetical protein
MSEAVGNLEVLEARGEVARDLDGGVYRFRAQDRAVASGSERP